jgi:Fe2+ transport system protein B
VDQDREIKLTTERLKREIETELVKKYDLQQRDFEEKLLIDAENQRRAMESRHQDKEEEISRREKQMLDEMQKSRRRQELDLAQRRDKLESELLGKYQTMQEELLEKEKEREAEKLDYKRELEMKYDELSSRLVIDVQTQKNEFEHNIW